MPAANTKTEKPKAKPGPMRKLDTPLNNQTCWGWAHWVTLDFYYQQQVWAANMAKWEQASSKSRYMMDLLSIP